MENKDEQYRLKTGITELDLLLGGGFRIPFADNRKDGLKDKINPNPPGLLILIRGDAGTGKSTLAAHIARGAWWGGKNDPQPNEQQQNLSRQYYSLEQSKQLIKWRFEWTAKDPITVQSPLDANASATLIQKDTFADLAELVDKFKVEWNKPENNTIGNVIVLDGLSVLRRDERIQLRFQQLAKDFRDLPGLIIFVYEPRDGEEEMLDHRADVVIELEKAHLTDPVPYTIHRLHIRKTRYQSAVQGWHQYKFHSDKIDIFPAVHFLVHHPRYVETLETLKPKPKGEPNPPGAAVSFIEQATGIMDEGHSVALFGARGTFKTELSLDFFRGTTAQGLLLSLQGGTLKNELICPHAKKGESECGRTDCYLCQKRLNGFHQAPGCITAAEFLHRLKSFLREKSAVDRLAFWDITQLDHRFPLLRHDPVFLPAFLEMLTARETDSGAAKPIKSLFMGAENAGYTKAFSALADNVVFCRRWKPQLKHDYAGDIEIENGKELILLYVDRTGGQFKQPNKTLHALPIPDDWPKNPNIIVQKMSIESTPLDIKNWIKAINRMEGVEDSMVENLQS